MWCKILLKICILLHYSLGVVNADGVLFNDIMSMPGLGSGQTPTQVNTIQDRLLQTYNRHEIPRKPWPVNESDSQKRMSSETPPLLVDVNMYVYSFSSISVVDMDYTIDFLLRQRWQDDRLKFLAPTDGKLKPISYLKDQLWLPDLFFRNAKNGFLHTITKPNYLIWIDANGTITFSQKLSLKVSCHMTLEKFPMDTQSCKVNIGSYGYAIDYLDFRWWRSEIYRPTDGMPSNVSARSAIEIRSDLEINEFDLISYDAYYCAMTYSSTGRFACLEVKFDLQRRFGFYLIYAYLPSMLIVVIAWVSFLLDPSAVPARVSIGLLCVLALITQSAAILTQLPRVSYVKAIDIWVFICLAFVVSSLLEFAAANTMSRRQTRRKAKMQGIEHGHQVVTTLSTLIGILQNNTQINTNLQPLNDQKGTQQNENTDLEETQALNPSENVEKSKMTSDPSASYIQHSKNMLPNSGIRYSFSDYECISSSKFHRLDLAFAIGYPILFILFNVAYWIYYVYYKRKFWVL